MFNFNENKISNFKSQRGFTLIELMVATTIFTSVILMALGSLIVAMDGTKKAQALRVSMDNVNFAMESMSRNIRTGTEYYCANNISDSTAGLNLNSLSDTNDCIDGGNAVAFRPSEAGSPDHILYKLDGTVLEKCISGPTVSCQPIVAENVTVDDLTFYVNGEKSGDNIQPSVYIKIKGSVLSRGVRTPFAIQTLASQRVID